MLKMIKEAFGETYPQGPELPRHVRRNHPSLDFLLDVQSAITLCKEGLGYVPRARLCKDDRDLLERSENWIRWHADSLEWTVDSMILVIQGADLIASHLERKNRETMPARLRDALGRFLSKLPPSQPGK